MTKLAAPNADHLTRPFRGNDAVQKLKMQLHALPEIRQQRIDVLKQAISDGTYKISPQAIATAMLSDIGLKTG